MRKDRDEYDVIWGKGPLPRKNERLDGIGLTPLDDAYSDVYDEEGYEVQCKDCKGTIRWRELDGEYVCPECGRVYSRKEFFHYIDITPPGEECYTCDNLYPGCMWCRHGYVK